MKDNETVWLWWFLIVFAVIASFGSHLLLPFSHNCTSKKNLREVEKLWRLLGSFSYHYSVDFLWLLSNSLQS